MIECGVDQEEELEELEFSWNNSLFNEAFKQPVFTLEDLIKAMEEALS